MQRTLIILKPDAVERKLVGKILQRIEDKGYSITALKTMQLNEAILKEHYAHLIDKPFFPEIVAFMVKTPVYVAIVEGSEVVLGMRNLIGKTNPLEAAPGTVRGDFATVTAENLIHASDSEESAQIEIQRFFS